MLPDSRIRGGVFQNDVDIRTQFKASWLATKAAKRKLRCLLWRGWTHRFLGGSNEDSVLGLTSHRDEYIRVTARNRCRRLLPEKEPWTRGKASKKLEIGDAVLDDMTDFGLSGFDPGDVQAAIAASLAADKNTSLPDTSGRQAGSKSSSREAGVPTPKSARARKKEQRHL